ncbi:MAG: arsenate reductase (glutaredoxin) [Gammaproteobacteria bacterium]|nr:arsenate reductase (glutaredoxin) [Gammaproteobacteria bacterium]
MSITIFHNPRCSKSRATLELLNEHQQKPEIIEYLKCPPSREQLVTILEQLGMQPRDLIRKHEAPYNENNMDDPALTYDELINLMIQHPVLIERPIVIHHDKVIIGRPPENVLQIL